MKVYVVPEPSERWATEIGRFGKSTFGLSFLSAGSFQLVILPRKMSATVLPSSLRGCEGTFATGAQLYVSTTAPSDIGMCSTGAPFFAWKSARR